MATDLTLIVEMVTVMGAATVGGYLAKCCRQPVLLGYLAGGIAIGPAGFNLVQGEGNIKVLAEIGVVLLLFALGVEFSLKDLLRVKAIALGGGTLQIVLTILLGGSLAYLTGWVETIPTAIFLGAVLSLSSTAIVLKSLLERNEVQSVQGRIMLAILVVQDLGLGLMLAVLPALTQPANVIGIALFKAVLTVVLFLIVAIIAGKWIIPYAIRRIAQQQSSELFLLGILSLCLGIALFTSHIGLGIEMGAFVAGLMVSNMEYADHALDRVLPMRDVFSTLFFASIGLLIDPIFLWENLWTLIGLVAVAMVGKAIIVIGIVRGFGYPVKTALRVGTGINQIGEFSFVLASVAQVTGLFSERLYGLIVGTAAATLLITPFVLKGVPYLINWLDQSRYAAILAPRNPPVLTLFDESELVDHVVVAGFGRVGHTLVRMLSFQGHSVLVIDNNEAVLQTLRTRRIHYLFGDASSPLVLEKANLLQAKSMAITLPDPMATRLTLNRALSLAPDLDITVRAHWDGEIHALYQLGAQEVVQPEFEAALEMGAHMLLKLQDSTYLVQQVVNRYRNRQYRDILPERTEYWGAHNLEAAIAGFDHRWYEITLEHHFIGHSIAELDIRRKTGATIMSMERDQRRYPYPPGRMIFEEGDRLLVVGSPGEQEKFKRFLTNLPHGSNRNKASNE